jgi:hypothetical protein
MADSIAKPGSAIPPAGPEPKPTPTPPAEKPRALPAGAGVCHENDRAVPGLKRYRVRATNADRPVGLYILAPDQETAEDIYVEAEQDNLSAAGFDCRIGDRSNGDTCLVLRVEELPD